MPDVSLRPANLGDLDLLRRWDEQPHVLASDPNDDWAWETELAGNPPWREQLIAEVSERPMPHLLAEAINVVVSIQRTETSRRIGELVAVRGVRAGEYVFTDLNTQELRDVA